MSTHLYPPESVSWSPERRREPLEARRLLCAQDPEHPRRSLEEVEREARRILAVIRDRPAKAMSTENKGYWLVGPRTSQRIYNEPHPDGHAAPVVHTWSFDWHRYEHLNLSGDVVLDTHGPLGDRYGGQTVSIHAEATSPWATRR